MTVILRAKKQFGYGGKERCIGEVFPRMYLINDEKLLSEKLNFLAICETADLDGMVHCDRCGRDFVSEHFYHAHLTVMHRPEVENPLPVMPVVPLEQEFPGGMVIDAKTGRARAAAPVR